MPAKINKKSNRRVVRRSNTQYKDLAMLTVTTGHDAVIKLLKDEVVTRNQVVSAVEYLKEHNAKHAELLEAALEKASPSSEGKGRVLPVDGETRGYKVQMIDDHLFVRIPVALLGVAQGDVVDASFSPKGIALTKAGARRKAG